MEKNNQSYCACLFLSYKVDFLRQNWINEKLIEVISNILKISMNVHIPLKLIQNVKVKE